MINSEKEIFYITNPEGKEEAYRILKEFTNEENGKRFVFYTGLEEDSEEVFAAEVIPSDSENGELFDITDEDDMKYVEDVFDEFLLELEEEEDALEDEEEEEDPS